MKRKTQRFIGGMGAALDLGAAGIPSHSHVGRGLRDHRNPMESLGEDWANVTRDFRVAFAKTVRNHGGEVSEQ
jgi:hypothetical protein